MVADFGAATKIRDLAALERGRRLLWKHGYDLGQGFVDVLSQYASLDQADRQGRLRDLPGLLRELNEPRPDR